MTSKGRIYLVGAGPGDPGLITVRGAELLSQADVVVYDYLVSVRLLDHAPPTAERIYVGKKAGEHTLAQDDINKLLVEKAQTGATVVRLKGGDPFVFGRGGEEALEAVEAGIEWEVVPGITAGVAGPAYAGIPVTHRGLASNLALITGHEMPGKSESDLDFEALARWRGTLVFYMGVGNLERICTSLHKHGLDGQTPAAMVRWGTTSRQRVVTGTLETLPQVAIDADIKPPALIVIGDVVQLRDQLQWFDDRPLLGKSVLVTRARAQASGLTRQLEQLGADVIEMPTIQIAPPDDPKLLREAATSAKDFDWIVFTSANAVDAFFGALHESDMDSRALAGCRICSVGPVTAERLAGHGITSDAQPARYLGSEIAAAIEAAGPLDGAKILCPRADIAPQDMIDDLKVRGAAVHEVVAYRTVPDCSGAGQVADLLEDDLLSWITFTSSSTVKNFLGAISPAKIRASSVRIGSIGPVTSRTLNEFELSPDVEAKQHTIDGLVSAILQAEQS